MERRELERAVLAIVHDQRTTPEDDLTPDTSLDEVGIDSLDALNIIFAIEEKFSIQVDDDEARNLRTPNDIVAAIERHLREGDAS